MGGTQMHTGTNTSKQLHHDICNSSHLLDAYHVPGTVLGTTHMLPHLILPNIYL